MKAYLCDICSKVVQKDTGYAGMRSSATFQLRKFNKISDHDIDVAAHVCSNDCGVALLRGWMDVFSKEELNLTAEQPVGN